MEHDDLIHVDPASLADLMDFWTDGRQTWSAAELEAILEHQMAADVQFDLERSGEAVGVDVAGILESVRGPAIRSFGDLFGHPQPPVELLDLTRRFAKACRTGSAGPLPAEIATVLYLASIAVARVRLDRRITALCDEALDNAFDWALDQEWLDATTRGWLQQGRAALRRTGS